MSRRPTREERDKHPLCGAKRSNGEPCRMYAGSGTPHKGKGRCRRHGGNTANHLKADARQQLQQEMIQATLGDTTEQVTPTEVLARMLRASSAHAGWLGATVANLPPEELGSAYGKQLVHLYSQERDRLVHVAKCCADLHIDERLLAIKETESRLLGEALLAACIAIAMPKEQQIALGDALRTELAVLEAEPVSTNHKVISA
jgi:hypothetical protein